MWGNVKCNEHLSCRGSVVFCTPRTLVSEPVGMLTLMPSQAFCRIQVWYICIHKRFAVYKSGMSIVHILEVAQIVSSLNKSFKFAEQMRGQFPRTSLYWPAKPFWPTSGRSLCTCPQTKQSKTSSTKDVILVLVRPICLQVHNKRLYGHQNNVTGQYKFWGCARSRIQ